VTRLSSRRFAPRLGYSLLALAGLAFFLSLGCWQLDRAEEKRSLVAAFEQGGARLQELPGGLSPVERYQRLRARGRFDPTRQFLLDNMTFDGQAGFRVLTPLRLEDGRVLLVDRGFVPGSGDRSRLPDVAVQDLPREVVGRADTLPRPGIELTAPPATGWPRIVSFPRIEEIGAALGEPVFPQVLLLDADQPDGYGREWAPATMGPDRHVGYAVQWFGFALVTCIIWVLLSFRIEESPE
jgi:surfeit locus 1 family protein